MICVSANLTKIPFPEISGQAPLKRSHPPHTPHTKKYHIFEVFMINQTWPLLQIWTKIAYTDRHTEYIWDSKINKDTKKQYTKARFVWSGCHGNHVMWLSWQPQGNLIFNISFSWKVIVRESFREYWFLFNPLGTTGLLTPCMIG